MWILPHGQGPWVCRAPGGGATTLLHGATEPMASLGVMRHPDAVNQGIICIATWEAHAAWPDWRSAAVANAAAASDIWLFHSRVCSCKPRSPGRRVGRCQASSPQPHSSFYPLLLKQPPLHSRIHYYSGRALERHEHLGPAHLFLNKHLPRALKILQSGAIPVGHLGSR